MWLGFYITKINLALGVVFILIYISAIAIVLVSVVLVLGAQIKGNTFYDFVVFICAPFFLFNSILEPTSLIEYPFSMSSIGLPHILVDLLVYHRSIFYLLTLYLFMVGLIILTNMRKSLYLRTNSGIRGLTLSNKLQSSFFYY